MWIRAKFYQLGIWTSPSSAALYFRGIAQDDLIMVIVVGLDSAREIVDFLSRISHDESAIRYVKDMVLAVQEAKGLSLSGIYIDRKNMRYSAALRFGIEDENVEIQCSLACALSVAIACSVDVYGPAEEFTAHPDAP